MRGRSFGSASPSTVLLLLVVLFFADLMVFLLIGSILMHLNWAILTFFILAPPCTQPVAVLTGSVFAFSENPRLGRLFAGATALGLGNQLALYAAVMWFFPGSFYFDTLEMVVACTVKVVLFICANVHIENLEAAHDLSFMDDPHAQAEFLSRQPTGPNSGHGSAGADEMRLSGYPNWGQNSTSNLSNPSLPESLLDDPLIYHRSAGWGSGVGEPTPSPCPSSPHSGPHSNPTGSPRMPSRHFASSPF